MEEIWRAIPGYEGIYEASNFGRIRTVDGKITSSARYPVRVWKQRILKPKIYTRKSGLHEQRVSLWKDGTEQTFLVSRLVAMSFLDIPFDKLTVNHLNGDPMDNRIENLEWCTIKENVQHGFRTGLYRASQKPVILCKVDDLSSREFPSMADADRFLGRRVGYTSLQISRSNYCYDTQGVRYWARPFNGGDDSS